MPLPDGNMLFGFADKLTDEQREYVDSIFDNQLTIVNAKAGTGKSQPNSELVLTPNGWKKMGDIKAGDYVIARNGRPTKVTSVHPQGELDVFEVKFSDGSSTRCSEDHLWLTENNKEFSNTSGGSIKTTKEIKETLFYRGNRRNHRIPIVDPINFGSREVFIDPYLLGVLLGDGGFSTGNVLLTNENDEIIESIKTKLPSDTTIAHKVGTTYTFRKIVEGNQRNLLSILLEGYGLLHTNSLTKFIPDDYLFNEIDVRIEILRGLMDTDGTIDYRTGKSPTLSTSSTQIKDGVVFLVRSLGGIATVRERIPKYHYNGEERIGNVSYEIGMVLPAYINPFRFSKKADAYVPNEKYLPTRFIDNIEKVGKEQCQCISVEDGEHLYVTKDFIVTHNTTLAVACAKLLDKPLIYTFSPVEERSLGFTPGTTEEKESKYITPLIDALAEIREDPRFSIKSEKNPDIINEGAWVMAKSHVYMRGTNIKDSTLIIDEAQNMTRGDLKKILTRCHDSTTVIMIGHTEQTDLPDPKKSGFAPYLEHFRNEPYCKVVDLTVNFRGKIAMRADELTW